MTAKTLIIATGAVFALGTLPALAGGDCGYGSHASVPETVASAEQSKPVEAAAATAIPYPLPTLDEDTVTAEVAEGTPDTATQ